MRDSLLFEDEYPGELFDSYMWRFQKDGKSGEGPDFVLNDTEEAGHQKLGPRAATRESQANSLVEQGC